MTAHDQHRLRSLAVATLVAVIGAVCGVLLTIVFPRFGMPQRFTGFLYIPPQACLVGLLAPTALVLAFATSISGLRQSQHAGQSNWVAAFGMVLLLLLLGPTFLICAFSAGWSGSTLTIPTPQDPSDWWLLAGGSAAILVLTAICALAYASRAISHGGPRQTPG